MEKLIYRRRTILTQIAIICILGLAVSITSCENEEYLYKGTTDTVWLSGDIMQEATKDSVLYSFKVYDSSVTEATLNLIVNLTGKASQQDRSFKLEIVEDETNITPNDYEIGTTVLPAGAYSVTIPIKVKRNASSLDIKKTAAKLTLRVIEGGELGVSITERNKYSFVWCDYLIKPSSWSNIQSYVGPFSQARYKFIIDYTGLVNFDEFENDMNRVLGLQSLLLRLLEKYNNDPANANREEGWPYKNDNGEPLQFGSGLIN